MTTQAATEDLERLQQLYASGFQDPFVENALRKIVSHQVARVEADLASVNATLAGFERQYSLTSDEFWRRFQAGEMEDSADFMEWNIFCKMKQRLIAHLSILRGENGHG